jgi:rhamnulokinase
VITPRSRDLNFTNEGGVCGTTRLLKNIAGLWLLQSCRRSWAAEGHLFDYEALFAAAGDLETSFHSIFDPDDHVFLNPSHMPTAVAEYCSRTGQPAP